LLSGALKNGLLQTHLCQALDVDELWIDDCLETLHYLDLYHEDSRVKHLLEDRKMKTGEPRIKLLNLLRSIQAASTIEGKQKKQVH
jgi:hypothetical protein